MGRSRTGQAIPASQCSPEALRELSAFGDERLAAGDLLGWQRARAIQSYAGEERDAALSGTFARFRAEPHLVDAHARRFREAPRLTE